MGKPMVILLLAESSCSGPNYSAWVRGPGRVLMQNWGYGHGEVDELADRLHSMLKEYGEGGDLSSDFSD
eukprot:3345100-Pyramimonas_sp.AAC.1